eukprot:m51a1_g4089 hypothetical protein (803) ;mRNA; f:42702-54629
MSAAPRRALLLLSLLLASAAADAAVAATNECTGPGSEAYDMLDDPLSHYNAMSFFQDVNDYDDDGTGLFLQQWAQLFTPPQVPWKFTRVCVALQLMNASTDFELHGTVSLYPVTVDYKWPELLPGERLSTVGFAQRVSDMQSLYRRNASSHNYQWVSIDVSNATGVPSAWSCNKIKYNDGVCDCGCGTGDIDCSRHFDQVNNCNPGETCDQSGRCIGLDWDEGPCTAANYWHYDGCQCECGGVPDPDCFDPNAPMSVCSSNYTQPTCTFNYDSMSTTCSEKWTCDPDRYNDSVICDCNCGSPDPDCDDTKLNTTSWSCDLTKYNDGVCNCGCGTGDIDHSRHFDKVNNCNPGVYQVQWVQLFTPPQVPWKFTRVCIALALKKNPKNMSLPYTVEVHGSVGTYPVMLDIKWPLFEPDERLSSAGFSARVTYTPPSTDADNATEFAYKWVSIDVDIAWDQGVFVGVQWWTRHFDKVNNCNPGETCNHMGRCIPLFLLCAAPLGVHCQGGVNECTGPGSEAYDMIDDPDSKFIQWVQLFTPPRVPWRFTRVCVALALKKNPKNMSEPYTIQVHGTVSVFPVRVHIEWPELDPGERLSSVGFTTQVTYTPRPTNIQRRNTSTIDYKWVTIDVESRGVPLVAWEQGVYVGVQWWTCGVGLSLVAVQRPDRKGRLNSKNSGSWYPPDDIDAVGIRAVGRNHSGVPPVWSCNKSKYNDGVCDCGCGTGDIDCSRHFDKVNGCNSGETCDQSGRCIKLDWSKGPCTAANYWHYDGCHMFDQADGTGVQLQLLQLVNLLRRFYTLRDPRIV